ncbi:hypothetical protein Tco_0209916 [Tanacetum coccineum]
MNELNELRDQAYENSLIYKEKTKKIHDSKIKNRVFNVGDRVLLFNSRLKIFSGAQILLSKIDLAIWLSSACVTRAGLLAVACFSVTLLWLYYEFLVMPSLKKSMTTLRIVLEFSLTEEVSGFIMDHSKVEAIHQVARPTYRSTEVEKFLGLLLYDVLLRVYPGSSVNSITHYEKGSGGFQIYCEAFDEWSWVVFDAKWMVTTSASRQLKLMKIKGEAQRDEVKIEHQRAMRFVTAVGDSYVEMDEISMNKDSGPLDFGRYVEGLVALEWTVVGMNICACLDYRGSFEILERIGEVLFSGASIRKLSQFTIFSLIFFVEEPESFWIGRESLEKQSNSFCDDSLNNHPEREATWETEESMRASYPHFFV